MRDPLRSRFLLFLSTATVLSVIVFDRLTKIFFSGRLSLGESIPVIKNIFHFSLVHNTGIAFGMFKDGGIVFIIIPIIAIIFIFFNIYLHRQHKEMGWLLVVAFSLILGGALGNLIDRLIFGYVIDFIDFRIWPVFNIADSAITIGTVIILFKCIPSFAE